MVSYTALYFATRGFLGKTVARNEMEGFLLGHFP